MKIRFLITAALAALSICVYAQKPPAGGPPGPMHGPGQGERGGMRRGMFGNPELEKQLNLSAAQKTKLQAINEKYRAKIMALFGRPGGGPAHPGQGANGQPRPRMQMDPAKRKQFEALRASQMKEANAVLNAKQQAILKKWIAAHPLRRTPGRPGWSRWPGKARRAWRPGRRP